MKDKIEQVKKLVLNAINEWKDEDGCGLIRDRLNVNPNDLHYSELPKETKLECG